MAARRAQKLGLSAASLRTAFTSLTSSLTSLRTELGGSSLTRRADLTQKTQKTSYAELTSITDGIDWDLYTGFRYFMYACGMCRMPIPAVCLLHAHTLLAHNRCLHKKRFDPQTEAMVDAPFFQIGPDHPLSQLMQKKWEHGVAHAMEHFGQVGRLRSRVPRA
jgi:hypothetical protein